MPSFDSRPLDLSAPAAAESGASLRREGLSPAEEGLLAARLDRARLALGLPGLERRELLDASLAVAERRAADAPGARLVELVPAFLEDFCLAHACRRRPPLEDAWRRLVERHSGELVRVAALVGEGAPEEAVGAFFGDLWVVRRGGRSLLDTYAGLGPLGGWLALVLRRRLVGRRRALDLQALASERGVVAPPADEAVLREEYLAVVGGLLERFLAPLSPRDRTLLEARVLAREQGVVTARRLGVSPAYVSRRFGEVVRELRARLAPWMERKGYDPEDAA